VIGGSKDAYAIAKFGSSRIARWKKRHRRCKVSLRDHGAASIEYACKASREGVVGLLNRRCKLVYRLQGFAKPARSLVGRFAERGQHVPLCCQQWLVPAQGYRLSGN